MDESWRIRMGMPEKLPNCPHRRSAEDDEDDDPLNPEHFKDVFGGPPRTILSRQFTTGLRSSSSTSSSSCFFYDCAYNSTQRRFEGNGKGSNDNLYDEMYGWDDQSVSMRSRSRSKASSSSVLSSEELSPLRFNRVQDDASLLASRLRQIDVYSGWNPKKTRQENHKSPPVFTEDSIRNYPLALGRRTAYPETISPKLTSKTSFTVSADDLHLNSPSSPVSSVCLLDQERIAREIEDEISMLSTAEQIEDEPTKVACVTEMNPRNRAVTSESDDVDEAVQWMKEKFKAQCLDIKHKLNS